MSLPPALVFDLSGRRVFSIDRYEARSLIAAHRAGAVHPVPGDILPLLWWSMASDPFATMPTLRGPVVWFGTEPTWRRIPVIPPTSDRLRFEQRVRGQLPPHRLGCLVSRGCRRLASPQRTNRPAAASAGR